MKPKILCIVGPTASGKSSLALAIASDLSGEIVSCDSMQIYRGMDIGTAKPSAEEISCVPHHLIDICSVTENFTLADYIVKAKEVIGDILSRGKLPILCGGTGLYLDTLLRGGELAPDISDVDISDLEEKSNDEIYEILCNIDHETANKTQLNNRRRIIRAIKIFRGTGIAKSEWDRRSKEVESPYNATIVGLNYVNREKLYERINLRVDKMVEEGLVNEVKKLNLSKDSTAGQAIGYKEIIDAINGVCTIDDAIQKIKQSSRNYAKRQLTWFKRNPNVKWFYRDELSDEEIINQIKNEFI